ncbi:MAG: hypothetical protein K0R38_108 [Polyangiaceae bacterium]|jgi:hypothetical protein|nr:hypothetical protein [Polyangiaceae bacterium]
MIRIFIDRLGSLGQNRQAFGSIKTPEAAEKVMFRSQQSHWLVLCAAMVLGSVVACGDDDDDGAPADNQAGESSGGSAGKGGSASTSGSSSKGGSSNGGEEPVAGSGSGAGGVAPIPMAEGIYVVGYYVTVQDEYIGYLSVTDDISADGTVDISKAMEFPGDMSYASPGNGVVYVGRGSSAVIERWVLNDANELEKNGEMGLAQYGIASGLGGRDPFHFLAQDRAYFIDAKTRQVVIWNPQTMKTIGAFTLEGFAEGELFPSLTFAYRDGDRVLLSARYYRADDTAALLTRVAIIDTLTDEVEYVDDERCGNIAFKAVDSEQNLYLASHPAQAAVVEVGAAGEPAAASCIIRIRTGESEFDQDYYVDLSDVAGAPTGGLMQGAGDEAFVLKYAGEPLTLANSAKAHTRAAWELNRLTLGDEAVDVQPVDGIDLQSAYGLAFSARVSGNNTPFIITVAGDLAAGQYHDVSVAGERTGALELPGFPGPAILVK